MGRATALVSAGARLGMARLYAALSVAGLPPRSQEEVRANVATSTNLRSTIDEYVQASASVREAAALHDLADKPLVVLTAGTGNDSTWRTGQDRLATLSTHSAHRTVAGASHEALIEDETYAAVTTQAVLDVVTAVRSAQPLPQ